MSFSSLTNCLDQEGIGDHHLCSLVDVVDHKMLRSLVISLVHLVPFGRSSCLDEAIPPALRKNLASPNGETYPVGFYMCSWAASSAANVLAKTLVEEILGYNTMLNSDNPGGGTVAGYYAMTGCKDPNNATDRGCLSGTHGSYHVHLEAWMGGYTKDWEYIQTTYSNVAPKNLGSHGYLGLVTMFIPRSVQNQAYTSQGKALQFYRAWNSSWNQPWNFFDPISSVSTSKLAPCNRSDSVMNSDALARRHVNFTGDSGGVVIINDTWLGSEGVFLVYCHPVLTQSRVSFKQVRLTRIGSCMDIPIKRIALVQCSGFVNKTTTTLCNVSDTCGS